MNQRQLRKREKRQNNEYWDQFESMLQTEEVLIQSKRQDGLQGVCFGECAVFEFQVKELEDWQFVATVGMEAPSGVDVLQLFAYPTAWAAEFTPETCFFQWMGSPSTFQITDWVKWVKVMKQQPLKAEVQAITGKKRLSEAQAVEWLKAYEASEKQAKRKDEEVQVEIKDYVRTIPYQYKGIQQAVLSEPVQIGVVKEWATWPTYQYVIQIQFESMIAEERKSQLLDRLNEELRDEVYRSRSYKAIVKEI